MDGSRSERGKGRQAEATHRTGGAKSQLLARAVLFRKPHFEILFEEPRRGERADPRDERTVRFGRSKAKGDLCKFYVFNDVV